MRKVHFAIIIILILIVATAVGIYMFNRVEENDDWIDEPGDDVSSQMIFDDVSSEYWASEYISFLAQREIMCASDDGKFYPDENMSIGEFAKVLTKASLNKATYESISGDDENEFLGYIKILEDNNVINENEIKSGNIKNPITKLEATTLLAKADMKLRNYEQIIVALNFDDLKGIDEVSQTLVGHGIARGFALQESERTFAPNKNMTRAEIAKMIYLFINN